MRYFFVLALKMLQINFHDLSLKTLHLIKPFSVKFTIVRGKLECLSRFGICLMFLGMSHVHSYKNVTLKMNVKLQSYHAQISKLI